MSDTTVSKNAKGHGYNYADLASINKYLEEQGIKYWQYTDLIEGSDYIYTVPVIDGKELSPRRGCRVAQANLQGSGKGNPAQEQGSALTYARRYSVLMAFGLAAEDDDGAASNRQPETKRQQNSQQTPQTAQEPQGDTQHQAEALTHTPATEAQKKAIYALCKKTNIDLAKLYQQYNTTEDAATKQVATAILTRLNNYENQRKDTNN